MIYRYMSGLAGAVVVTEAVVAVACEANTTQSRAERSHDPIEQPLNKTEATHDIRHACHRHES